MTTTWKNGPVRIVIFLSSLEQNVHFVIPKNQRNMITLAKLLQAMGIGVIAIGFISNFPELINGKSAIAGLLLFTIGWIVERYLAR